MIKTITINPDKTQRITTAQLMAEMLKRSGSRCRRCGKQAVIVADEGSSTWCYCAEHAPSQNGGGKEMSKASNYREALMFNKRTEPPKFELQSDTHKMTGHWCLAELTAEGLTMRQGNWIKQDEMIKLSQDDALKLRDWITEMFEGK